LSTNDAWVLLLTYKGERQCIIDRMTSVKRKKKNKKTKKAVKTKIILMPDDDGDLEDEGDKVDGGMFFEKEDIQLIYNALSHYKPTENEEHLLGLLLEEFEEILVVDYNEPYPDAN
jgi:hypothetical protein